ncbi:MAG: tetratricopeptide repeat protein [Halobacteria archaeon]|nr:tetratricopeptide repeat protein [Halobacteria archaeon]
MSLINDMLRDLDARRAHPAAGNLAALPAASIGAAGTGMVRQGVARLFAGLVVLTVIAIGAPLVTDHLGLFDWGGPGGPVVMQTITLPTLVKKQPDRQARAMQLHTRTTPYPGASQTSEDTPGRHGTAGNAEPAHVTEDTAIDTATTAGIPAGDQGTPEIVVRRHGPGHEYRLAASAAAAGNELGAIDQLKDILAQAGDHHRARLLLARLYIRQQQNSDAEILLQDGLASHPLYAPYARLLAHLLVTDKRHDEAIARLESALPGALRDADYQALLAGLYQRSGKPAAAVQHYTRALELSPQQGEWWMGLGISQEQSGNLDAARTAYREALKLRLDAALQDYIGKRLRRLSQQAPAAMTNIQPAGRI